MQAGADVTEEGPAQGQLEEMLDYRSVLEAEVADLYGELNALKIRLNAVDKRIRTKRILSWIMIPLGLVTTGTGIYFLTAAEKNYQSYRNSDSIDSAGYRETTELYDQLGYSLLGSGLAVGGAGAVFALTTPDRSKLEEDREMLRTRIEKLEEQLK